LGFLGFVIVPFWDFYFYRVATLTTFSAGATASNNGGRLTISIIAMKSDGERACTASANAKAKYTYSCYCWYLRTASKSDDNSSDRFPVDAEFI